MANIRGKKHYLCSELVTAKWHDRFHHAREEIVNLGEIWECGALLETESPIRVETSLRFVGGGMELHGRVTGCSADFAGNMVEIEFEEGCRWSPELWEPEHLFDPRSLVKQQELDRKNERLLADIVRHLPEHVA